MKCAVCGYDGGGFFKTRIKEEFKNNRYSQLVAFRTEPYEIYEAYIYVCPQCQTAKVMMNGWGEQVE